MKLTDPHDSEFALHVEATQDPAIVEVRASNGVQSLTVDVRVRDLEDALHTARINAALAYS